jgi:hypothetical protein
MGRVSSCYLIKIVGHQQERTFPQHLWITLCVISEWLAKGLAVTDFLSIWPVFHHFLFILIVTGSYGKLDSSNVLMMPS